MSQPQLTPADLEKAANTGFVTHLLAAGVPATKVAELLPKYQVAKVARTTRFAALCRGILGHESKMFATPTA